MLVKTILAYSDAESRIATEVIGYYEIAQRWNMITEIYLEREELEKLIVLNRSQLNRISEMNSDDEKVEFKEGELLINVVKEKIIYQLKFVDVWKFSFIIVENSAWYNKSLSQDDRIFSAVDIYDAILKGLLAGHEAGIKGRELIGGHSMEDYAWIYMERQEGS